MALVGPHLAVIRSSASRPEGDFLPTLKLTGISCGFGNDSTNYCDTVTLLRYINKAYGSVASFTGELSETVFITAYDSPAELV